MQAHSQRLRFTAKPDRVVVSYDNGGDWVETRPYADPFVAYVARSSAFLDRRRLILLGPVDPRDRLHHQINTVVLDMETDEHGKGYRAASGLAINARSVRLRSSQSS